MSSKEDYSKEDYSKEGMEQDSENGPCYDNGKSNTSHMRENSSIKRLEREKDRSISRENSKSKVRDYSHKQIIEHKPVPSIDRMNVGLESKTDKKKNKHKVFFLHYGLK